jgi:hypothetical protein
MALAARDVRDIAESRMNESSIVAERFNRAQAPSMRKWKQAIEESRRLYAGNLSVNLPDGTKEARLSIENIYHDSIKDAARSAAESTPSLFIYARGNMATDKEKAALRQSIANGYWHTPYDLAEDWIEQLVADYLASAGCFLLCTADREKSDYPFHVPLDPMGCYPTFFKNDLIDFMYVEQVPTAAMAERYGAIPFDPKKSEYLEVLDFWTPREIWKLAYPVARRASDSIAVLDRSENRIGRVPVAWAAEFGVDRNLEVMFSQIGNVMKTNNTIMGMIHRVAEKGAYGGWWMRGEVDASEHGPEGLVHGLSPESEFGPIQPPRMDPAALSVFQLNENAMRGAAAYPAQRQGGDLPSIISGSAIAAVQGQRASLIRFIQRKLAKVRRDQTQIDFELDRKYLNFEKPLLTSIGRVKSYTPAQALDSDLQVRVVYGDGGVDILNRSVMMDQQVTLGILPREIAMSHNPFVRDVNEAKRMIEMEESQRIFLQKMQAQAGLGASARLLELMGEGKSTVEAAKILGEEGLLVVEEPMAEQPGPAAAPVTAEEQALALQQGATQPTTLEPTFTPPPFSQIVSGLRPRG